MEERLINKAQGIEALPSFSPPIIKLIGTYERNIDSKSRLGLPVQFRDKLEGSPLILLRWLDRSIAVFPECNWQPYAESIARLDLYTAFGQTVRRQMFANAREVSMDKEGRIILPPDLMDYARIDGKVMMLGDWDKISLWNYTYYRDQVAVDDVTITERFPAVLQLAKGQKRLEEFEQEQRQKENG